MSNFLVDLINQQPVREALELVGGRMLEDRIDRETAIHDTLKEIPYRSRMVFQRIMDLNAEGKTVEEITTILIAEHHAKS